MTEIKTNNFVKYLYWYFKFVLSKTYACALNRFNTDNIDFYFHILIITNTCYSYSYLKIQGYFFKSCYDIEYETKKNSAYLQKSRNNLTKIWNFEMKTGTSMFWKIRMTSMKKTKLCTSLSWITPLAFCRSLHFILRPFYLQKYVNCT